VALKRTGFGVFDVALSRLCGKITVGVRSDVPLPLHMHSFMFATGFVDDALRYSVPTVNEPLLQLVDAMFRLLCNVR